ncbi:DUF1571 domain-containing protein [Tundrisphaera lichenicola]|uniref:DUF1571 domain-containing protein n=1 Tax=Tundrisphaera lichenicola TaxID=2029860 RepID=UPI003EBD8513
MTFPFATADSSAGSRRRRRKIWVGLALIPAVPMAASWWFTEPLVDHPVSPPPRQIDTTVAIEPVAEVEREWPEVPLTGDEAKRFLLEEGLRAARRIEQVVDYTATFRKQERIAGKLGPEQTMAMKVRNNPFAIYLKFLAPKAGKEVVYAEGHHDNKVIAHNGDWTRRLIPRLAVEPDSAVALADTRHPVTEAGLVNLSRKLLQYRKMDIGDPDAETIVDRTTGPDGRPRLRSTHIHHRADGSRPFAKVVVLYDPETRIPIQISSYDWPASGGSGELELAERYTYDDLRLDATLTYSDFDPKNPDYAFMRF